jgi:hypothetical protein
MLNFRHNLGIYEKVGFDWLRLWWPVLDSAHDKPAYAKPQNDTPNPQAKYERIHYLPFFGLQPLGQGSSSGVCVQLGLSFRKQSGHCVRSG